MIRNVAWRVLFVGVIGIGGCHHARVHTLAELGCGAGAYAGQPVRRSAARWPETLLGVAQRAALHVGATDAATGAAAVPLNIWIIQGTDTSKARTNVLGEVEFSALVDGPAEVRAWFFNFASTRVSVLVRTGYRDSVVLRLGRTGNECLFKPDVDRASRRRPTRP